MDCDFLKIFSRNKFMAFVLCVMLCAPAVFAQEEVSDSKKSSKSTVVAGEARVPEKKRPRSPDSEKAKKAAEKDENADVAEKTKKTLQFGVSEEIIELINSFIENDDPRYADALYDLFQETKNIAVREKIISYFTKIEDPCISDYAVTVVNDPFDEKKSTVTLCINYITAVKCKDALPALVALLEQDSDDYFNDSVLAVGELGGADEAVYLTELFQDDDTSTNRKQSLMRALGKIGATETWEELSEIAKNEDENSFVRMYAAEAIGNMKVPESVDVLAELFEGGDPNMRQYIIKGLKNFPGNKKAEAVIIQGIRDDHWRVRVEAIKTAGELKLKDAVPSITYRAENDKENAVKRECWPVIAALDTSEGNKFLIEMITDKKKGDATKISAAEALLKEGNAGENEIIALARETLTNDSKKQLRYNLGKSLAKYSKSSFSAICGEYLSSKDVTTVAIGLDMYKTGRYGSVQSAVQAIADDKKAGANQKLAKRILGIKDEE